LRQSCYLYMKHMYSLCYDSSHGVQALILQITLVWNDPNNM
jgi:hypothetical protein